MSKIQEYESYLKEQIPYIEPEHYHAMLLNKVEEIDAVLDFDYDNSLGKLEANVMAAKVYIESLKKLIKMGIKDDTDPR